MPATYATNALTLFSCAGDASVSFYHGGAGDLNHLNFNAPTKINSNKIWQIDKKVVTLHSVL